MIITYTKDGGEKFIDSESKLIPIIEADGWVRKEDKKPRSRPAKEED